MAVDVLAHALPRRQLSLMFGNPRHEVSPPRDGVVALRVKTASSGTLAPHTVSDGRPVFTVGNWRRLPRWSGADRSDRRADSKLVRALARRRSPGWTAADRLTSVRGRPQARGTRSGDSACAYSTISAVRRCSSPRNCAGVGAHRRLT